MKQRYKIKTTNTELPDERILKHKNFDQLLTNYKSLTGPLYRKPLYKNPKLFMSIFLAATIVVMVYLAFREEGSKTNGTDGASAELAVADSASTFPDNLEAKFISFTLDPGKTTDLNAPGGIHIHVPANAFPKNCSENNGKIELKFRSLDGQFSPDGKSVLAPGANPLHTCELRAFCNGQPVELNPGQSISVVYPVRNPGEGLANRLKGFHYDDSGKVWNEFQGTVRLGKPSPAGGWDGFVVIENPGSDSSQVSPHNLPPSDTVAVATFIRMTLSKTGLWSAGENAVMR